MKVYDLIEQVSNPQHTATYHVRLYKNKEDAFEEAIKLTANNDQDDGWDMVTYHVEEREVS